MQLTWNNRFFITGTSRTGKSYFRDWIIKQYIKNKKRDYYVVVDDRIDNSYNLAKYGFKIIEIDRDRIKKQVNYAEMIKHFEKVVFVTGNVNNEEVHDWLNNLCYTVFDLSSCLFVIDEAWIFLKRGRYEPDEFARLMRGGAKQAVDTMIVTQRFQDISPDILTLVNRLISFRINEINTLKKLAEFYGQFYDPDIKLVDQELNNNEKRKCNHMIQTYNRPESFLKNLPNYYYMYSDTVNNEQELSSTIGLSI